MRIKKVELLGFKSFADKTIVSFDRNLTSVVGPNGCGKTNIIDAVKWVLGEQSAKALRGKGMEEVIFNGSDSRKPLGMSEVSLHLTNENDPFAVRTETMVTRRLYRSGESEYLLNKVQCRLKDVTEMFMDTGVGSKTYAIIEQERVTQLINQKPEERRYFFEEAAGISKYKARKKEAETKMEQTNLNLQRIADIIHEVRRNLNSLNRQASKARKYKELKKELKEIELSLSLNKLKILLEKLEILQKELSKNEEALFLFSSRIKSDENLLHEKKIQLDTEESELNNLGKSYNELTLKLNEINSKIELKEKETEGLQENSEREASASAENEKEKDSLNAAIVKLSEELNSVNSKAAEIRKLLEAKELDILNYKEKTGRNEVKLKYEKDVFLREMGESIRESNFLISAKKMKEDIEYRIDRIKNECDETLEKEEKTSDQLNEIISSKIGIADKIEKLKSERNNLDLKIKETADALKKMEDERKRAEIAYTHDKSKLNTLEKLEENLEGYFQGVKELLKKKKEGNKDFEGLAVNLSEIIEARDGFEEIVEDYFKDKLQAFVAKDENAVLEAVKYLKENNLGKCRFLIDGASESNFQALEGLTPLTEKIIIKEAEESVKNLFSNIYVFETLNEAFQLQRKTGKQFNCVTMDGNFIQDGFIYAGSKEVSGRILTRKKEIKELSESIIKSEEEIKRLEADTVSKNNKLKKLQEEAEMLVNSLKENEMQLYSIGKDEETVKKELLRIKNQIELFELEEKQLNNELKELAAKEGAAKEKVLLLEQNKIERESLISLLDLEINELKDELEKILASSTDLKVQYSAKSEKISSLNKEIQSLSERKENLNEKIIKSTKYINENAEKITCLEKELLELKETVSIESEKLKDIENKAGIKKETFNRLQTEYLNIQEKLKEQAEAKSRLSEELNNIKLETSQLSLQASHIKENIYEKYDWEGLLPEQLLNEDEKKKSEERSDTLKKQIESIGEVNLMAIEDAKTEGERLNFLLSQEKDIKESLESLDKAIKKINATTKEKFLDTFNAINDRFREVFSRLFIGGKAHLVLTDEENLLETGIDIVVQPPGKRLQNINLLSGGEKALTGVSLVFAIFLIKPAPFCILDEVDASLDDANIERFNSFVKELSDKSQFIIVTHNKKVIENSDAIYGITMEEPGVSKVLSMRLN